jgi:hypothetical protein
MGQYQSQIGGEGKKQLIIKKKQYDNIDLVIPYSQLDMIHLLQRNYDYEVKGTVYFDEEYKFLSFEVRTDNSEIYSTGASDWRISYHTHPDKTAQKYGLRYYSPPSVDDVMEILDKTMQFIPDSVTKQMGELSIIFTNEGIYTLQADRDLFKQSPLKDMSENDMESYLQEHFNEHVVNFVKSGILKKNPNADLTNPDISKSDFYKILQDMSVQITDKFGIRMDFNSWDTLKSNGLSINTSNYFVSTLDD